jgi:ferrous-iron efflux pump FieF
LSLADAHDITDSVEQALQNAFPAAEVIVHQEPAGLEDERLDRRIARPRKG